MSYRPTTTRKTRVYWTAQILGWTVYALLQIVASAFLSDETGLSTKRLWFFLYEALCGLVLTHVYRQWIHRRNWMKHDFDRLISRLLLASFVLGFGMYFSRIPGSVLLGFFNFRILFEPENIFGLSAVYFFIFLLWSGAYFVYNYFLAYNNSLKLEASMREIELSNLKSQLNPHFIFNALNSIRALIDENPVKSKQAVTQLSGLLRSSLSAGRTNLTSLEEELRIVKDYLGLESIRFEERLTTEFQIDPQALKFQVPPLMLQTLVENGIKHGISRLTRGGLIQIIAEVNNDRLHFCVRNSGQITVGTDNSGTGLGLENTRQRLRLIYGDDASLSIQTENNNFVRTEIVFPYVHARMENNGNNK